MPKTDVLIAGSGSAGIFAATWLALYNIPFVMLERRSGPLDVGQADGVQCRTTEIYESFGLAEELLREAQHILEVCFWGDDENEKGKGIKRKSRTIDTEKGLTHLPHLTLNQARMNGLMLHKMSSILRAKSGHGKIEYGWNTTGVEIDSTPSDYPCRVTASKDGAEQVWQAKYVLACDGAHSTVRRALGFHMLGDTTDTVWGVMDIFPRTNFPDIRRKCTVHSAAGNVVLIPREGGQLVRFYIQLPAGTVAKSVTLCDIQNTAKTILRPYEIEFAETAWWSAYSIGQRLVDHFHAHERVFLTGDAAHTHSPKAGQGMNVSLADGYNIGWKLGAVLAGISPPCLLATYVSERGKTAADLIAFDRELTGLFNRKEAYEGEFASYFMKSARYMAGFHEAYGESMVTVPKGREAGDVARRVAVGMRFPSAQVIRLCDCKAVQLLNVLRSTGAWRVVVFGGDVNDEVERKRLGELAAHLEALTKRFTPPSHEIDSVIEPVLVLSSKYLETEQESIPSYFSPATGKYAIRDLHKTYIDDEHYNSGHGHAYAAYGVDPGVGAVVLVRPDQYVSKVTTLDDHSGISDFFSGCLLEQRGATNSA